MKPTMSEEKSATYAPQTFVIATSEGKAPTDPPKRWLTKKYVIIGATVILTLAIILAAILIGMYFFTEAQKDILKYTLTTDKNDKQDVTAYPSSNVVTHHANSDNYETWVITDYNKDIQVFKIKTQTETNCYAVPFNTSTEVDVSKIKIPPNTNIQVNGSTELHYTVANTPIADTSFLSKQARDECQGTSIYWLYPSCNSDQTTSQRKKRDVCCPFLCTTCCNYWYCYHGSCASYCNLYGNCYYC